MQLHGHNEARVVASATSIVRLAGFGHTSTGSAMKKSFISALASALIALALTGSASAAQITYVSINGIWHDPTDNLPGSQPGDPVITNGIPTSIIRWGTTSGTPQSG